MCSTKEEKTMNAQSSLMIESSSKTQSCCSWLQFHDVEEAKGLSLLGMGRGPVVMANVFLTNSILFLASREAGCVDEATNMAVDNCTNRVYGIKPSSIFTSVAVVAGILSATLMPVIGAMVDYTPYRRQVGIYSSIFILIIEAISIVTIQSTWFVMALLQIVCVFTYHMQSLTAYAYLPDIARVVGEDIMTDFTGLFVQTQFTSQLGFLMIVILISTFFGFNDVGTAHVSQAVCVVFSGALLFPGWRLMEDRPPNRDLQEGQRLLTQGFVQIYNTTKMINKHYRKGVKWYFLALVFAEAGTSAFMVIAATYLADTMKMKSNEIGFGFFLLFLAVIPGATIGQYITKKTNPNTSWKLSMAYFMLITTASVFVITEPERKNFVYVWGVLWGLYLGWFYSAENLFFALCLPKGREAELSGFYTFCTQSLVWLPPLFFIVINESGMHQKWGLMMLNIFYILAITMLTIVAPWDEVMEEASKVIDLDEEVGENSNDKNASDKYIGEKADDNYNKNTGVDNTVDNVNDIENISSNSIKTNNTLQGIEETQQNAMDNNKIAAIKSGDEMEGAISLSHNFFHIMYNRRKSS